MADPAPEAGQEQGITGVRWALHLPTFAEPQTLIDLAVAAERHGWDGCFFWDHILGSLEEPMPVADTWVVLGTPVEAEYGAFGEPMAARELASRLDEGLAVLAGLWTGEPLSHHGAHFTVEGAAFVPGPVQQPRIPIWAACTWPHRKPLQRAARWDGAVLVKDGGMVQRITPAEIAEARAAIRRVRGDERPFDLAVVATDPRDADGYAEAGATWVLVTGWLDTLAGLAEAGPR